MATKVIETRKELTLEELDFLLVSYFKRSGGFLIYSGKEINIPEVVSSIQAADNIQDLKDEEVVVSLKRILGNWARDKGFKSQEEFEINIFWKGQEFPGWITITFAASVIPG